MASLCFFISSRRHIIFPLHIILANMKNYVNDYLKMRDERKELRDKGIV